MCHCLYLGSETGKEDDIVRAFLAAYIHDMSRKHDGYCTEHGQWAANVKLPQFASFFRSLGLNKTDISIIKMAVANHSVDEEFETTDPAYITTAVLKDADALDRIRLGESNLNSGFLRFEDSHRFIQFAQHLYFRSKDISVRDFSDIFSMAYQIKPLKINFE